MQGKTALVTGSSEGLGRAKEEMAGLPTMMSP
jgi:short-subunit dehydrogenase